jgi:predicted porin
VETGSILLRVYLSLIVLLASFHFYSIAQSVSDQNVIAPYRIAPSGSARSMAMGGAYTAVSDDLSALVYNPAGMVFGDWSFDLNVENSRISDREVTSDSTTNGDLSEPSDFIQGGLAYRPTKWLALAAGLSNPYQLNLKDSYGSEGQINLVSGEAAIAIRYSKFSLGVGYHYEELTESYKNSAYGLDLEEKANTGYLRAGIMLKGKKTAIGISYTSSRTYTIDKASNADIPIGSWFRDAKIPSKVSLGLAHKPNKNLLVVIDFDSFGAVENAIYPGSGESLFNYDPIFVEESKKTLLHGGVEWTLIDKKNSQVLLRGGYYNEPSRLAEGENRSHFTYGAEIRLGPAKLTVSFDQASDYNNTSQGFSLVLGSI